jgi:OTU domain-containing protein 6
MAIISTNLNAIVTMGRKGGGRAGFMKANRKGGPESDEEEEVAVKQQPVKAQEAAKPADASDDAKTEAPSAPVISKKAAAFLVGSGDGSSDDSDADDEQDRSASGETRGQMVQRHKREAKTVKEQVKRLGKKGKDEAAKLETEVKNRHAAELASLAPAGGSSGGAEAIALADSLYAATINDTGDGAAPKKEKKLTKAQQRREKQAQKDAEREARIAAENAELGETERMAEENALKKVLAPLGLKVKDIPPDGHCLYRSLEDQLNNLPDNGATSVLTSAGCEDALSFLALRQIAAEYMRENADHFKHFIGDGDLTESNGGGSDDADTAFELYCNEVENTAAWGGHVEIEALSRALKTHIQVFSAGMTAVDVGQEFKEQGGPTLQLCYLRHAYGLGEHYNSVKHKPKKVTFEGDCSSSEEEEDEKEEGEE